MEEINDIDEVVPGGVPVKIWTRGVPVEDFGEDVYVTRKGAVSARAGQLGIVPGSMGARSHIVRGKGNVDSFESCSHGAGRVMRRDDAKRRFTLADHRVAPKASNAARTGASSTRRPPPTRTSTPSWQRNGIWSRWCTP